MSELRCKSTVLMHCFHSVNFRKVYRSAWGVLISRNRYCFRIRTV